MREMECRTTEYARFRSCGRRSAQIFWGDSSASGWIFVWVGIHLERINRRDRHEGTLYALLVRRVAKLVVCNPRKNAPLKRCQWRLKNPRFLALEISSVRCKLRFRIRTGSGRRRTKPVACSPELPAPSRHSTPRGPAPIPYLSGSYLGCGSGAHSGSRLVLQPVALTLDVDRRGVVQQPVEDGRSNHVVGEVVPESP
jgi:hypothetical protein